MAKFLPHRVTKFRRGIARRPSWEREDLDVHADCEVDERRGAGPIDSRGGQKVFVDREKICGLEGIREMVDLTLIKPIFPERVQEIPFGEEVFKCSGPGRLDVPVGVARMA